MSKNTRVVHKRREAITALPLYHAGHLQKKSSTEKDFKKFYGELRGATLFLYTDDTQDTYTDRVDLEKLKSLDLDGAYMNKKPTGFTLKLRTDEVQLKMENPDAAGEWRVYILTVNKREIPRDLPLLPGQKMKLEDVLAIERKRKPTERPPLPPRPDLSHEEIPKSCPSKPKDEPDHTNSEMPACFFDVTRDEAVKMLEENPECGSIILRPSTLANNYALTLRQLKPGGAVLKNFRVTSTKSGFVIELDAPVTVPSLNHVVNYFLEKTEYRLQPYRTSQPYDMVIGVPSAPKSTNITSNAPKMVPRAQVAPMKRPDSKEKAPPPQTKPEENDYVIPEEDLQKLKKVQLDGELRNALKQRREVIYGGSDNKEDAAYQRLTPGQLQPGTARWDKNSSQA
ncbi:signal-transducing adaptor protein 1-like [Halichoeres trimaculatus]|uniref:signal-transducing adaptor protein 1-like n=1 Tax=Halichoeres trimaculatus TaxID=147232 RepID=UPI003D9EC7A6